MIKNMFILLMLVWAEFSSAQIQHYYKGRHEYELNDAVLNNGITVLRDSGYITFGSFEYQTTNERYAALLRFNSIMQPIDTLFFGFDSARIEIKNIFELSNGFLAIGHKRKFNEINRFNPYLVRLNKNLDTVWTKTIIFGQDTLPFVSQVIMCHDSTIAIAGNVTRDSVFDDLDVMFLRIDTIGNVLNYKKLGYLNEMDEAWSITQTLDNGFALGGYTKFGHSLNYRYHAVFKLDSLGNQQWLRKWGRNDAMNDGCTVIDLLDSSILISTSRSTQSGATPNTIPNLIKVDNNNNLKWDLDYGSSGSSNGIYAYVQKNDSTIFCLKHDYSNKKPNHLLIKSNGTIIWERINQVAFGDHNYSQTSGSNVTSDNGFVVSGFLFPCFSCGDTGTQDIFVIKSNCLGFADPPFANATTGSLDNFEVVLENNSMYFGNCFIDWGDGNFDTLYESSDTLIYHTYATDGNFNATIIAEACGDKDTLDLNIVSSLVGVSEYEKKIFRVYPNPSNEILFIQIDNSLSNYEIILTDISGKVILRKENCTSIDVSDFLDGIYFISIPDLNHTEKIQIIK